MSESRFAEAWWDATAGIFGIILDSLPDAKQAEINDRLQVLARAQELRGNKTASYFARAVSGESPPAVEPPQPPTTLGIGVPLRLIVDNTPIKKVS